MATTTNYAWETPNDTDLVKDGASAIRTLGSSIDTTTKALNPSTTLGDIEYRSATANTNTRLPIGTNGKYLTVSGGVPAWGDVAAGMTQLATGTLSGATVNLTSISGSFNKLILQLTNFYDSVGGGQDLYMRFNNNSTANAYGGFRISGGSTVYWGNTTQVILSNNSASSANRSANLIVEIPFYTNTNGKKLYNWIGAASNSATNPGDIFGGGVWANTAAINEINLLWSSTGQFGGGTYTLYGAN